MKFTAKESEVLKRLMSFNKRPQDNKYYVESVFSEAEQKYISDFLSQLLASQTVERVSEA